jgi:preprotein translocase subunit SecE
MFEKTAGYLKETQQELNKVTWPSRNELWQATVVVIVATFLMAAFTALIDMVLSTAMRLLLR